MGVNGPGVNGVYPHFYLKQFHPVIQNSESSYFQRNYKIVLIWNNIDLFWIHNSALSYMIFVTSFNVYKNPSKHMTKIYNLTTSFTSIHIAIFKLIRFTDLNYTYQKTLIQ